MELQVIKEGCTVIKVTGEIDLSTVDALRAALDEAVQESPDRFIIDLSGSGFIDSTGLGAIVSAYRSMHAKGGKIAIVSPNQYLKRILSMIGLQTVDGLYLCEDMGSARQQVCAG